MNGNDLAGHETPARPVEPTQNTRVTARSVAREQDGARTVYRANGREFPSLEALQAALGREA